MDGQDWTPLTIRGAAPSAHTAGAGRQIMERQQGDRHLTALAETTDPKKPKLLSREAIAKITEYRRSQNLTQKQLDQQLAFPPNTTNRLEARNLAPTSSQLTALNRVIKGGLRLES